VKAAKIQELVDSTPPSNKGILVLASSGTVQLELEYRKPDSKETRMPHDRRLPRSSYAVFLRRRKVLVHSPSAGSAALAHHLSSTAVTLVPVVIICSTENPKE
jgi:hypothetical protein